MADPRFRKTGMPLILRIENGQLIAPDKTAARIENFYPTSEGTLRSIVGPCLYQPDYSGAGSTTEDPGYPISQDARMSLNIHGIFHALLMNGTRDVLLVHTENQIFEHEGWNRGWHPIVRPGLTWLSTDGVKRFQGLPDKQRPCFPTQFERTPNGIVIVPQTGRAMFYDGEVMDSLGYAETPGAPVGLGPVTTSVGDSNMDLDGLGIPNNLSTGTANSKGYAHDSIVISPLTGCDKDFRFGRVGTTQTEEMYPDDTVVKARGVLLKGEWRGAVQWVDKWGNISPLSSTSNAVSVSEQWMADGYVEEIAGLDYRPNLLVDVLRKFIAWTGIEKGPDFTVGRILYRTKDMLNSGTAKLFEVPASVSVSRMAFSTLPGNKSTVYPDNTPDSWLAIEPIKVVPVPIFKLCKMAFGRLWIANTEDHPGMLRPSLVGRFGSFPVNEEIFPDPQGDEITGLWQHESGLLVFTQDSTFLIVNNSEGTGFRTATISTTIGCVAPSSIAASARIGMMFWLGRDGFYAFNGKEIRTISEDIFNSLRDINKARRLEATAVVDPSTNEYMCWLPLEGAQENSTCLVYDGVGWRRRTDTVASAACVTRDHRGYVLVGGKASGLAASGIHLPDSTGGPWENVFVLNRQNTAFIPDTRSATIETVWLTNSESKFRKSPLTVFIWLRETGDFDADISVTVYRDWRKDPLYTDTVKAFPVEDKPSMWDETMLGTPTTEGPSFQQGFWERRRPYWVRASLFVPSCEVFKFEFVSTHPIDFFGFSIDTLPHDSGGARVPEARQ